VDYREIYGDASNNEQTSNQIFHGILLSGYRFALIIHKDRKNPMQINWNCCPDKGETDLNINA